MDTKSLVASPEFRDALKRFGIPRACERAGISHTNVYNWLSKDGPLSLEARLCLAHAIGWRVLVRAVPPRRNKVYRGKRTKASGF